jgi:hypothetical protein
MARRPALKQFFASTLISRSQKRLTELQQHARVKPDFSIALTNTFSLFHLFYFAQETLTDFPTLLRG